MSTRQSLPPSLVDVRATAVATDETQISLVIPTYNERANVVPLLAELDAALAGLAWEVLFVDDSTDGTDAVLADLAADRPRLRVLHRRENRGGLAGAVVDGFGQAHGQYVCVMDADLQHPPALIPELLREALRASADVVIASRYLAGGSAGGLDGWRRRACSQGLRLLSRLAFRRRLTGITDPLGGYFLIHRGVVEGVELRPIGYKILLEVLVRCPWRVARELPYRFQPRRCGESKADLQQGLWFLRHLTRLLLECSLLPALRRERATTRSAEPTAVPGALPRSAD